MLIAEMPKTPVGKAAATDAHEIHNAVTCRPQFGAGDLAEDGHVVRIKKSPAETKQNKEGDGDPKQFRLRRVTDTKHRGHNEQHADGTGVDSSTRIAPHPAVGEPAARDRADDCCALPIDSGRDPRFA